MPNQPLPTKAAFVAHRLDTILGGSQCQHIFGSSCLQQWIDSNASNSNTCPMCREVLFIKPPRRHVYIAADRRYEAIWRLEDVRDSRYAWAFVRHLRGSTAQFARDYEEVWASDLEILVNLALWWTVQERKEYFKWGLFLTAGNMGAMKEIVKEMIDSPPADGDFDWARPAEGEVNRARNAGWFRKIADVVGWDFI